jgi:hypothetical protein
MGARPKEIRKEVNSDQLEDHENQNSATSPPEINEPPGNALFMISELISS